MDASGQITVANQSQKIYTAGDAAERFTGQNTSGTTLYLKSGEAASRDGTSYQLRPGQIFDSSWFPIDQDLFACGEAKATYALDVY